MKGGGGVFSVCAAWAPGVCSRCLQAIGGPPGDKPRL